MAAEKGESDFGIHQESSAKFLDCTQRNVSDIIQKFKPHVIELTAKAVFKGPPARYRWAIESTLTIPFVPEDDTIEI